MRNLKEISKEITAATKRLDESRVALSVANKNLNTTKRNYIALSDQYADKQYEGVEKLRSDLMSAISGFKKYYKTTTYDNEGEPDEIYWSSFNNGEGYQSEDFVEQIENMVNMCDNVTLIASKRYYNQQFKTEVDELERTLNILGREYINNKKEVHELTCEFIQSIHDQTTLEKIFNKLYDVYQITKEELISNCVVNDHKLTITVEDIEHIKTTKDVYVAENDIEDFYDCYILNDINLSENDIDADFESSTQNIIDDIIDILQLSSGEIEEDEILIDFNVDTSSDNLRERIQIVGPCSDYMDVQRTKYYNLTISLYVNYED